MKCIQFGLSQFFVLYDSKISAHEVVHTKSSSCVSLYCDRWKKLCGKLKGQELEGQLRNRNFYFASCSTLKNSTDIVVIISSGMP